jgi:hypothetical protein
MAEMTVPNGEKYGELQQKVTTIWTDLYTNTNGDPVVNTWRAYFAVQKERDKASARRDRLLTLLVVVVTGACSVIEVIHLMGK